MALQELGARHWRSGQSPCSRGSVSYCSPKQERYGLHRTSHIIQPHMWQVPASGMFTAQTSLSSSSHTNQQETPPSKLLLLRPVSGPVSAHLGDKSQEWDSWYLGRWTGGRMGAGFRR